MPIYALCCELFHYISAIFLSIFAQFGQCKFRLMLIFPNTKSCIRQEPSVISFVHLVLNHSFTYTIFCLHCSFSKVSKNHVRRGPSVPGSTLLSSVKTKRFDLASLVWSPPWLLCLLY